MSISYSQEQMLGLPTLLLTPSNHPNQSSESDSDAESSASTDIRSDAELVQGIWTGERAALGVLYDRHARLVYSLAIKLLGNVSDAEDLTQEVFLSLLRQRRYDPQRGALATYLTTLTRSRAIDRLRSQTTRQKYLVKWQRTAIHPLAKTPLEQATHEENKALVQECLASLEQKQSYVLEQSYYAGRTYAEIAAELGIPLNTVKSLARRGLIKLRQSLANPNGEENP
ncbi:MAG: sigma-70 family RNA polymerase sigma factor [Cyanobacteria bacterium P01_H01_bin.121]